MDSRLIDCSAGSGSDKATSLNQHRLLLGSISLGVCFAFILPGELRVTTRFLAGWNLAALGFMTILVVQMLKSSEGSIRRTVASNAATGPGVLALSALAVGASFTAVLAELSIVKQITGYLAPMHVAFAIVTILSAWSFIHVKFALHYASSYFAHKSSTGASRNLLEIHGVDGNPDFFDFLYFAITIGISCSTSDTSIHCRRLRRTVMTHGVLAFFFNMVILGFTMNIASTYI